MVEASFVNFAELAVLAVGFTLALLQIMDMTKARTAELYLRLWERWNTTEFCEQRYECYRMEWTDHDDFLKKYSWVNKPDVWASFNTFGRSICGLAELRRKKLIDITFLDVEMVTDIMNWWTHFGPLMKEGWEEGDPGWPSHFPFITEVVEYDRRKRPWLYDKETGVRIISPFRQFTWIQPEEIEQLRRELYR